MQLGEAVLHAIKRNDGYVLAHAENRRSVEAEFREILSYFVDEPVTDPDRLASMAAFESQFAAGQGRPAARLISVTPD